MQTPSAEHLVGLGQLLESRVTLISVAHQQICSDSHQESRLILADVNQVV